MNTYQIEQDMCRHTHKYLGLVHQLVLRLLALLKRLGACMCACTCVLRRDSLPGCACANVCEDVKVLDSKGVEVQICACVCMRGCALMRCMWAHEGVEVSVR